jgi:hypothetical protein
MVLIKAEQYAAETDGDPANANFQKAKFVEDFNCPCVSASFRFRN